jgi:anti-sigma B factor antagonist
VGTVVFTTEAAPPGVAKLRITGELDLAGRDGLAEALQEALARPGVHSVLVDLGPTTFIDSSAVGALVTGYRAAAESGRRLRAINAGGSVLRVLTITGVAATLIDE